MKELARNLRKNQTDAENKLWYFLRNRHMAGYKFYRQYTIEPYIADFCCRSKKLIIELDGGQHAELVEEDKARTAYLESQGFKVLRFWNNEVLNNTNIVLDIIYRELTIPSP